MHYYCDGVRCMVVSMIIMGLRLYTWGMQRPSFTFQGHKDMPPLIHVIGHCKSAKRVQGHSQLMICPYYLSLLMWGTSRRPL